MKQAEARAMLGLDKALADLTEEIVVEAWRGAVKRNHPDTATAAEQPQIVWTVDALSIAKKTLLDSISGADFACKLCSGRGKVPAKMGWRTCSACKGTGDKR